MKFYLKILSLFLQVLLILFLPFSFSGAATTYLFLQTDWSGGQTANDAVHPVNNNPPNDWKQYSAKDANLDVSAGTEIDLSTTLGNWLETTDAHFNAGDKTDYIYVGSDTVYPQRPDGYACESNDNLCRSGNCDGDFSSGNYCHTTASSCVDFALGTPWERADGYELCSGNSYYKSCANSVWGAQQNCDTNNAYCDAGGGAQSGWRTGQTCSSGLSGGCQTPSCTSCSPYIAASTSSCKTSCTVDGDCWSGYGCSGSVCVPPCSASTTCGTSCYYQGITYTTVQVGTQCWFSKNLNYGTRVNGSANQSNDGVVEKYCYSDSEANCTTDGGLYQWPEAMALSYSGCIGTVCSVNTPHQGLCPSGWHIPTDTEWTTLTNYLSANSQYWCGGVSTQIAKSLASTDAAVPNWTNSTTACQVGNDRATNNSTGFTTLPAGYRNTDGSFYSRSSDTHFWSASQGSATLAWRRYLYYNFAAVGRASSNKAFGFSVRCLKN